METSDGSERTFFIARSISSITGLEDPCHLLKIIFSGLYRRPSALPDVKGYCCFRIAIALVQWYDLAQMDSVLILSIVTLQCLFQQDLPHDMRYSFLNF